MQTTRATRQDHHLSEDGDESLTAWGVQPQTTLCLLPPLPQQQLSEHSHSRGSPLLQPPPQGQGRPQRWNSSLSSWGQLDQYFARVMMCYEPKALVFHELFHRASASHGGQRNAVRLYLVDHKN